MNKPHCPASRKQLKNSTSWFPDSCDIFCNVVDNYGDVGVCWRLSRIFVAEFAIPVRLWVDDPASLAKLHPDMDKCLRKQSCAGVEVHVWDDDFPEIEPAELVIGAFACKLPQTYIDAMAAHLNEPVWINLEYLSGEDWVAGCHKLPSPHPRLTLTKYFFFPGFSDSTGGLLVEHDLLARRDAFQQDVVRQQAFWQGVGVDMPATDVLKISLFGYENAALNQLFDSWALGNVPVLCVVPEGRISPQAAQYFGVAAVQSGEIYVRGNLQVCGLPFIAQERYDQLLWACDINFVRGEDSFVRAQWAARPFVWQIYLQQDDAHIKKLDDFLDRYCDQLHDSTRSAVSAMWRSWNGVNRTQAATSTEIDAHWQAFAAAGEELQMHARCWSQQLATNNLALNLLDFCQEIGRMRGFELEG